MTALQRYTLSVLLVGLLSLVATLSQAVVIQDNFTGVAAQNTWDVEGTPGPCLTAGNNTGTIPACSGITDTAGNGALRLTKAANSQSGAIISTFTFPSDQGIQATFNTYTYGGDSGGVGNDGADGISFFLMNGNTPSNVGAWGGSLAYSCSNSNPPYNGMVGAYLGLGIDEYGNFLNRGDNTASGWNANGTAQTAAQNSQVPGRIGLRGYGNISWSYLNSTYSTQYPDTLTASQQEQAVRDTCRTGMLWDFSNPSNPSESDTSIPDYQALPGAYAVLPSSEKIANESTSSRANATPISYKLKLTSTGLLSFWYSYNNGTYQPILTNQSITASNGPLPSSFKFGFAGSTGGSTNVHEITCFKATPADTSASSASLNVQQSGELKTTTQVYLAYYHPDDWWGQLKSQSLQYSASTNIVSIDPVANWDASCVLTGGVCSATSTATNITTTTAEPPSATASGGRQIITDNGASGSSATGIPFEWTDLTTSQQDALNAGDDNGTIRLDFLRGDRSNEQTPTATGIFRLRKSVLGDIINSSPTWVGPPSASYPTSTNSTQSSWSDKLYPSQTPAENSATQTYGQFQTANATRLNVVYDGANDGMMHAFRTGSYDASGNYVNNSTTPNDGKEILAFMPNAVLQKIHNSANPAQDYSSPDYAHAYFDDATPGAGDLFYNGAWHTWLVGGLGAGGADIFALDITNPSNFSETNAASIVKGEWTSAELPNLGDTYGTPQIRRFHNGDWGIIFGNGFNSANGLAGIYILLVDHNTGNITPVWLSTGVGTTSNSDGIAYTTPADLDDDHIVDYVYAGDQQGNLWRFDLTSSNPSNWSVDTTPLFTTPNHQPITTKVLALSTYSSSSTPRIMLVFGTGSIKPQTISSAAIYASGQQTLYGIWDWDMSSWNSLGSTQYASVPASSVSQPVTTSDLQTQSILGTYNGTGGTIQGYRTVSSSTVCWYNSSACASNNTQFGWMLDLPGTDEQVIYSPTLIQGAVVFNTTIPPTNSPLTCTAISASGWTMALNPANGGAFQQSFFGDSTNHFATYNGQIVSGIALNATGSASAVNVDAGGTNEVYLVNQTKNGNGTVNMINPPTPTTGGIVNWIQLR